MAVNLVYPPGATPLDADELACLIPKHITTQGELNEWEQLNILQADTWARRQRRDILVETFVRLLHKQMFGDTWSRAGSLPQCPLHTLLNSHKRQTAAPSDCQLPGKQFGDTN